MSDVVVTDADRACCACLRVEFKPVRHSDGTCTERWCCVLSDEHEFIRRKFATHTIAQAHQDGQEAMREKAAKLTVTYPGDSRDLLAAAIRALPTGDSPKTV